MFIALDFRANGLISGLRIVKSREMKFLPVHRADWIFIDIVYDDRQ